MSPSSSMNKNELVDDLLLLVSLVVYFLKVEALGNYLTAHQRLILNSIFPSDTMRTEAVLRTENIGG